MSAALALILNWVCSSPNLTYCGARAAALLCLLDPINAPHHRDSLANIAREAGVTRAAISKWIVQFREEADISLTVGKLNSTRETFRNAQLEAVANGTHAGQVRNAKRIARLSGGDVVSSAQ
jgi:transposase-like protein